MLATKQAFVSNEVPPLDESLYNLSREELQFFKDQTGIRDEKTLREHILQVQADAYAVYPYPCIRNLSFTTSVLAKHPAYQGVWKAVKINNDAIFLDLGCAFGIDARKAISDGYPLKNIITADINAKFWELGHQLFKTTPGSFPLKFLQGDIFDPKFISPDGFPMRTSSDIRNAPPPLQTLTSLTSLQQQISVIHVSFIFHLFDEEKQRKLARMLGALLSPSPGSLILGSQMGYPDADVHTFSNWVWPGVTGGGWSLQGWKDLWTGKDGIFMPEDVSLDAIVTRLSQSEVMRAGGRPDDTVTWLTWSITRV